MSLIQAYGSHIAEELWERLGHERLWEHPWPEADPALLGVQTVEVVVQVNGRIRDCLHVSPDLAEAELAEPARSSERVQAHMNGGEAVRTIVVPGKLVNFSRALRLACGRRVAVLSATGRWYTRDESRFPSVSGCREPWLHAVRLGLSLDRSRPRKRTACDSRPGRRAAGARTGTASAPEIVAPLEPVSLPSASSPARAVLVVHVVGAVRRPGSPLARGRARVADAVARAGGSMRGADLAALNLAAPLVDGIQVRAGRGEWRASPPRATPMSPLPDGGRGARSEGEPRAATADELDEPRVGPVTAQKILDYRAEHGPFRSVDELDVPGIGPTRVEQLRDLVTP